MVNPENRAMTSDAMEVIDPRDMVEQQAAFDRALNIVSREYITQLKKFPILPVPEEILQQKVTDIVRLYRLDKIVYAPQEDFLQKLPTVLYAAYTQRCSVIVLIESDGKRTRYYLGVVDSSNVTESGTLLHDVFTGNFMGSELTSCDNAEIREISNRFKQTEVVTAISGIPALRNEDKHITENFVQGVENIVNSLSGCEYSILIKADPVSTEEITQLRTAYQDIYSMLRPYAETSYSFNATENFTYSILQGQSTTVSTSVSNSKSISDAYSENQAHSDGTNEAKTKGSNVNISGAAIGGGLGAITGAVGTAGIGAAVEGAVKAAVPVIGKLIGGALGSIIPGAGTAMGAIAGGTLGNMLGSIGFNRSKTKGAFQSDTRGEGRSHTEGHTSTEGSTNADTRSSQESDSQGISQGKTVQFAIENRKIKDVLKKIDQNLQRIEECESYGTFASAAYVMSNSVAVNQKVASVLHSLTRGDKSSVQSTQLTTWQRHFDVDRLKNYLAAFSHPIFGYPLYHNNTVVTATLPVSGKELSLQCCMPKQSFNGVVVMTHAEFGRNPFPYEKSIHLGELYHMGQVSKNITVTVEKIKLSSHTFITGSTGTGKSNTIYRMLNELDKQDVRFLVVEPAKGEYKNVFGGRKNVAVYGTNRKKAELLQLNPFSFPEDTHVLEHIDRLVEIFNACWPMYAAMPAVLKDAVEQAYLRKGWDLTNSTCDPLIYPTFRDLMDVLPDVVKQSNYSADTQSDYIGSLYTRIKSLTNGINGQIFCSMSELAAEDLFDRNVIVDLSRVGSMETKALLMGILVRKLQEHRMAMADDKMDTELRHVTVLEEAHNLLRRTSDIQTQESSNLQGKSVEMIANAIAEMRTYGEGFIIADQAPGLMDESVIRNTNTKIIMRLPDESDRVLVGKAASLNDDQIVELAKLPLGIAAVYQNDWLEPVLCKIKRFSSEDRWAYHHTESPRKINELAEKVCKYLLSGGKNSLELSKEDADRLSDWIASLDTATDLKKDMLKYLKSQQPIEENQTLYILYCIVKGKHLIENTDAMFDVVRRQKAVDQQIMDMLDLTEQTASEIRKQIFLYAAQEVQNDIDLHRELLYYGGVR